MTSFELDAAYSEALRVRTMNPAAVRVAAALLMGQSTAIGYELGRARAVLLQAWADIGERRFAEAEAAASTAFDVLDAAGDGASALNALGMASRRRGDHERAARCFNGALARAVAAGDARERSIALRGLAGIEMMAGDVESASLHIDEAERVALAAGLQEETAEAQIHRGVMAAQQSRYDVALALFTAVRAAGRALGHRFIEIAALGNMGAVHALHGDVGDALRCDLEALAMSRDAGDDLLTAERLGNLGTRYQAIGDYARAHGAYQQSLSLLEKLDARAGLPLVLGNLGSLYIITGDHTNAAAALHRGLATATMGGDRRSEAFLLLNLGKLSELQGNARQALLYHLRALRIHEELGDPRAISESCLGIGQLYTAVGDHPEAERFIGRAIDLARSAGLRREESEIMISAGRLQAARGDAAGALDTLETALAVARLNGTPRVEHEVLAALVEVSRGMGEQARAREYERAAESALQAAFHGDERNRVRSMIVQFYDAAIEQEARRVGLGSDDLERLAALPVRDEALVSAARSSIEVQDRGRIQVYTLGDFRVVVEGRDLADADWGRRRSRELFKLLVCRHHSWVSVDEIFERLWGEHDGQQIEMVVMKAVSNLRKAFGGARSDLGVTIRHDNGAYMLDLGESAWVDFLAFKEKVLAARRSATAAERERAYAAAAALYGGEYLPQDRFVEWTEYERESLRDAYLEAEEFLAREHLRASRNAEAVEVARRILACDAFNATGIESLVEGLRRLGRTAEAGRCRDDFAAAYREEFGEEPVWGGGL